MLFKVMAKRVASKQFIYQIVWPVKLDTFCCLKNNCKCQNSRFHVRADAIEQDLSNQTTWKRLYMVPSIWCTWRETWSLNSICVVVLADFTDVEKVKWKEIYITLLFMMSKGFEIKAFLLNMYIRTKVEDFFFKSSVPLKFVILS